MQPEPIDMADPVPSAQRDRILTQAAEDQVLTNGADIVFRGRRGVLLSYPRRVSHGMHAILTLLTGGLWAIVWYFMATSRSQDRLFLESDAWGNVWAMRVAAR